MIRLALIIFLALFSKAYGSNDKNFMAKDGSEIGLKAKIGNIEVIIRHPAKNAHYSIRLDSEKQPNLNLNDYNQDSFQDFSVSYLDDGMGAYSIHRIFLYAVNKKNFIEVHPSCGDEFINAKFLAKKRLILSTYFVNGTPKMCRTYLANKKQFKN